MNQQTKQCKTCYLTINQLCDKINETIKLEYDNEKHKFKPYTADLYIMIISNDNIYNDRFNKNMVVCKPKALSIFTREYMDYKELCNLLKCDKLYIKINKRYIEYRTPQQIIEIDAYPEEFTNEDGEQICYHKTSRLVGVFYKSVINEYEKYINKKKSNVDNKQLTEKHMNTKQTKVDKVDDNILSENEDED